MTIQTESVPTCCVCGAEGIPTYEHLLDALFGAEGGWSLKACANRNCGLFWLDPRPVPRDIGHAYSAYYTHPQRAVSLPKQLLRRGYQTVVGRILPAVLGVSGERRRLDLMYLETAAPGRLLDVGCGDGSRLAAFRQRGWQVAGQDVDIVAVQHARERYGLPVHFGPLDSAPFEPESFDALVSSHVIEHVHDPLALLAAMQRVLKPGGTVILTTPNIASTGHARFKRHWLGLDPPRHLHLFSIPALEALVKRAGFRRVTASTSCAHAQAMANMSLLIEARRAGRPLGALTKLRYELDALRWQREAIRKHAEDPWSGDECVVRAVK